MAITLPSDLVYDIRQPVVGDSFGWSGVEPAAAKKSVVFHHSGSDAPSEDGFSIADYHVNHNGWGGCGYHFIITREDYPGRPQFGLPAGAQIQYVGDLLTYRAHVANQNPGRVGVCIVGMEPTEGQLRLARRLMEFLVAPNNILPSINYMNQATVHKLVPEQSTECPGHTYEIWLPYLQGGPEPYWFSTQQVPTPTPEPTPIPVHVPTKEEVYGFVAVSETASVKRTGAYAVNVETGATVTRDIPVGTQIDVGGYFTKDAQRYIRTKYSVSNNLWNGIPVEFTSEPTGQVTAPLPVSTPPEASPSPNTTDLGTPPAPTNLFEDIDEDKLREAFLGLPQEVKATFLQKLWEPLAFLLGQLIKTFTKGK